MVELFKLVALLCVGVIEIASAIFLVVNYMKCKKCIREWNVVKGIPHYEQSSKYVSIEYEVGCKSYKKRYLRKSYYDTEEKTILIKYLKENPSFCIPHSYTVNTTNPEYYIFALVLLVVMGILLVVGLFCNNRVFDTVFNIIVILALLVTAIVNYIINLALSKADPKTTGKIVNKGCDKNNVILVAEYILNGKSRYTREMKVPIKENCSIMNIGDVVDVKYLFNTPDIAIISDDIYSYRNAKTYLLLAVGAALIITIFFIMH